MALVVELVIGQFEFVEAYNLAHPRLTGSRGIRMDVDSWRDRRVGVTRYHPLRAVVHVPWNGGKKSQCGDLNNMIYILCKIIFT